VTSRVTERDARQVAEAARETEWRLPSFGRELFLGNFRLDLIHPQPRVDPALAAKGEEFLTRLRAFLEEHADPAQIERDARIPDDVVDGLKQLGAFGMKVAEQYGGLGLSQVDYNRALALANSWHSAFGALLSAHQSIGVAEPLRMFGTEEQKQEWLPKVARTHISAFLLTEPDVGSDPARLGSTATPTQDGTGYRLSGRKLWATNGAVADLVVVMAQVPPSEGRRGGITAFIVPYDSPGVTVEHRNAFMGLRGIENSVTRFDDVFVPAGNVIGREGQGLKIALSTLNTGRLALPAICAGVAKWSTKVAREGVPEGGRGSYPPAPHDAVAQKLAFMAASTFGMEAMVDVCSRLADDKQNDIRIEAAIAKLYASELTWRVVDDLVQIRGGRGYETAASLAARGERPVAAEQALRDMRINRIFEGSTEIMHLLIAREAVDRHLQVAGDILEPDVALKDKAKAVLGAGAFYGRWLPQLATGEGQKPNGFAEFGNLAEHLRFAERASRRLARSTFYGISRWQAKLERRQAWLGRIVDIGAELFAIAAAVVYANTLRSEHPERGEQAAELADLFCRQARRRVDALFGELWSNDDDAAHRLALQSLEGRYAWLDERVMDPSGSGPAVAGQPTGGDTEPSEAVDDGDPALAAKVQ
jgi:alkylation response protein AidB-like acyl-CoA dehydrogenase